MGDSLENQDVSVDTQNAAVVDYGAFANYLRKAATILLPEDDLHIVPPALNIALEDRSNQDAIKKFLSDSQVQALYIQRTSTKGNKNSIVRLWVLPHFSYKNKNDVIDAVQLQRAMHRLEQ